MKGPNAQAVRNYACHGPGLKSCLEHPGDGRLQPEIPARDLVWSLRISTILRVSSSHHSEWLVHSPARAALGVGRPFGDDAIAYFAERLDPTVTRLALAAALKQAKRNKAFDNTAFIGLAIDGTTGARCRRPGCPLCRPFRNPKQQVVGYRHHWVMITVVGAGLRLPFDVEPYGPGDSEYAAGQRLLRRAVPNLGPRFADSVVVDGEFITAPFLHAAEEVGLKVVARRKENLPELLGRGPEALP